MTRSSSLEAQFDDQKADVKPLEAPILKECRRFFNSLGRSDPSPWGYPSPWGFSQSFAGPAFGEQVIWTLFKQRRNAATAYKLQPTKLMNTMILKIPSIIENQSNNDTIAADPNEAPHAVHSSRG